MTRFFVLALLSFAALCAQTHEPSASMGYRTFQNLQKALGKEKCGAVVAVAPEGKVDEAKQALESVMADERILPYSLYRLAQTTTDEDDLIGKALSEQQGWKADAERWAFVDSVGQVAAEGAGVPSPEDILKALGSASIRPRIEILKQIIRQRPELMEAQMELLDELKYQCDIRAFRALKIKPPPGPPRFNSGNWTINGFTVAVGDAVPDYEDGDAPLLGDSDDEAIWSEYERTFNGTAPKMLDQGFFYQLRSLLPDTLKHSPKLKKMANRFASKVEDALKDEPSNLGLWDTWIALKTDRSIIDLLDELEPLRPFPGLGSWPPEPVRNLLFWHLRRTGGWERIIGIAEPFWLEIVRFLNPEGKATEYGELLSAISVWANVVEPLLESYIATGRMADAEQIVDAYHNNSKSEQVFAKAAEIAKKHGFNALAEKWGKLKVKTDNK
ncbi:MAG: hypothetical protein LBC63_08960 [Holophagales bacterium]|nr:hypothetical protein [Holophagales bacterium]